MTIKDIVRHVDPGALLAAGWLLALYVLVADSAAGDPLLPVLAVTAVMLGAGCSILLFSAWRRAAGSVAVAATAVAGGVGWLLAWQTPSLMPIPALAMLCGLLVGAVGIRAREVGAQALRSLATAGLTGAVALLLVSLQSGSYDTVLTAGVTTMATVAALAVVLPVCRPERDCGPRLRDVVATVAALGGAGLPTFAASPILGESVIFIAPVILAIGGGAATYWMGGVDGDEVPTEVGVAVMVLSFGGLAVFALALARMLLA